MSSRVRDLDQDPGNEVFGVDPLIFAWRPGVMSALAGVDHLRSLELAGGKAAAFDFLRNLTIAHNAVSLGGVETLACHPASTTHSEMNGEERATYSISDDLVRLSIGVEDWRDLVADFRRALDSL